MTQNSKKTESLAQLKFSLDNLAEEKEAQLQARQAEEIADYRQLEELAQNFDFLILENFLRSSDRTHKITLVTYQSSSFRQKVLFGFKTKAFVYADLLNFILIFFKSLGEIYSAISLWSIVLFLVCSVIGIIFDIIPILHTDFSSHFNILENIYFEYIKINIPFFLLSYLLRNFADLPNANFWKISRIKALTKFSSCKDDYVLPLEIKIDKPKYIKLPEFRLLFKELQAMKLQPKLQITICEDYLVDLTDLETKKPIKIEIEIEINKNKFTN